jgi:hypothetical protein
MPELSPEAIAAVMAKVIAEAGVRAQAAMTVTGTAIERQAKVNASSGEHRRGTPTPARPGSGPARISGTLVRSITHSEVMATAYGWEMRVGLAGGLYPNYGSKAKRTASSKYGEYLEKGMLRNGSAYPFLGPAVTFGSKIVAYTAFRAAFAAPWRV